MKEENQNFQEVHYLSIRKLNNLKFIIPSYQRGYRWNSKHVDNFQRF